MGGVAGIDRKGEPSMRPAQGGLRSAWMVTGRDAARSCCRSAFQCQGRNSCRRVCGISAMRAKTSASQAWGVDVVELSSADERVHHHYSLAAAIGAREQPGFASERDDRDVQHPLFNYLTTLTSDPGMKCDAGLSSVPARGQRSLNGGPRL